MRCGLSRKLKPSFRAGVAPPGADGSKNLHKDEGEPASADSPVFARALLGALLPRTNYRTSNIPRSVSRVACSLSPSISC